MADYHGIFEPLLDLFSQSQIQTILLAWIPTKFKPYMTDNMAVDMFLTSVAATGLTALFAALYALALGLATGRSWGNRRVTVQVEYYVTGTWGEQYASTFYEALAWLISNQTKQLERGNFIVQPDNDADNDDESKPPEFKILPENDENVKIEWKGKKFDVNITMPDAEVNNNSNNNNNDGGYRSNSGVKPMPSIYLTAMENTCANVDSVSEFLDEVASAYLDHQRKTRVRSRYERQDSFWYRIQSLSENRGLETVALSKPQEDLIRKELDTFVNDKDFYSRVGMPYRRGIILFGKPGTGKTSLINAISSHLNRDLYFVNLKTISDDNELSAAFSSVPSNQIIVLEDVDTQSKVLHKRSRVSKSFSDAFAEGDDKDDKSKAVTTGFSSRISLSAFLSCLDGHIMSEGNIIVMTTNHIEYLDPAVIRPGRMDVQLDLGYTTHYQLRKMYNIVTEGGEFPEEWLVKIPERVLPPCEIMTTLMLWRNDPELIPEKIYGLVEKHLSGATKDVEAEVMEPSSSDGNSKADASGNEKKDESKEQTAACGTSKDSRTISTQTSMTITAVKDEELASVEAAEHAEERKDGASSENGESPPKEGNGTTAKNGETDQSSDKAPEGKNEEKSSKSKDCNGTESDSSTDVEEDTRTADVKVIDANDAPAAA